MSKVSPSKLEYIKLIEELKLRQTDLETRNRELSKQISRYNLNTLTNIENESKLFTLADNLPGYIAFVNAKTLTYGYVNKAYQNSFGIPIEEIVGKHVREVIGETNFQFALKYIEMVLRGKSASYENTFNMVNGKRWISVNYAPDFDKAGNVSSIIVLTYDITERKNAEQLLKENETKLLQLNAEKDKFFSLIAHDLRSPFNVFLGFTKKMVEELDTMPIKDLQKITLSMSNSATNLFQLLENLLDWSRFQRGLLNFDRELFLLNPKITDGIQLALDSANKKGIKIELSIPEGMLILADKNMLGSIVRNLTANAVKFTPKGGKILIKACSLQGNSTEISVKDTGIGMNKNILEHLFMLNEKTGRRGTEGEPSTGLGLIICKDLVEKHGGKIWAVSEEGKGSTFKFTLPASGV